MKKLIVVAVLAAGGATAVGAWWAYREFCQSYEDMVREQGSGPSPDEPSPFRSQRERRDH